MKNAFGPKKLTKNSHIRIIAPARSLSLLSQKNIDLAKKRLEEAGFVVTFGRHVAQKDEFGSSSIESRIEDLHEAFADKSVDGILTVIGGFNSNQLLQYIDYDLIANNPKLLCGYSDITALLNAIYAKTGMITYLGPHFSSWGMEQGFEYTQEYFEKCCMSDSGFQIIPSKEWSDDAWYLDQNKREFVLNAGWWVMNEGHAEGRVVGGNLCTYQLLFGTEFMNSMEDSILVVEDDSQSSPVDFDRDLQSLIHQPSFVGVQGILIGRFQKESKMTRELLQKIIGTKKEMKNISIIANVDFGHTTPMLTLPIGGRLEMMAGNEGIIRIVDH